MTKQSNTNINWWEGIALPTESEIISSWNGCIKQPLVSIVCTAFNHKQYLEDALKGFFIQQTSFPFEVILHDDASSDGSAEIINKYLAKYPKILKPIMQVENQYSLGVDPLALSISRCIGEYIALCEGDDFWIYPHKLTEQVQYLQDNPTKLFVGSLCQSASFDKDIKGIPFPVICSQKTIVSLSPRDIFKMIHYVHTSTHMFRRALFDYWQNYFKTYVQSRDLIILITTCLVDKNVAVLNKTTSVYRQHDAGEWNAIGMQQRYMSYVKTWNEIYSTTKKIRVRNCQYMAKSNLLYFKAMAGFKVMSYANPIGSAKVMMYIMYALVARVEKRVRVIFLKSLNILSAKCRHFLLNAVR